MSRRIILVILALGFILRIVALGQIPGGFTPDEASQGYIAYSLLKTGKDEWGLSWPFTSFRAFGDYHAALQTYFILPSVAIFGLNEFSVRLPSAIFGTLSILAVFLLTNFLYPKKIKVGSKFEIESGHFAALIMAISPWSIQFSRTALEANYASFMFPFGLYCLLRGIKNSPKFLALSAIVFGLNLYSYHAAKMFVPLFLLGLIFLYRKTIFKKNIRYFLPFVLILGAFALPIYFDSAFGPGNARGKDLIITNYSVENLKSISDEQYLSPLNKISPTLTRIFSNKITFTIKQLLTNYVSYLSPSFWFTEGGRETTYSVFPGNGLIYLWMFPLIILAIYKLITEKNDLWKIFAIWLFLGIIPAAITKEGYRPNRAGSLMSLWEIISAIGFVEIFTYSFFKKRIMIYLSGAVVVVSLIFYLNLYYFVSSVAYPDALNYGYRELISKTEQLLPKYNQIIIDKGSESQMFVAFYTKMDPGEYRKYSSQWWPEMEKGKYLFLDMIPHYQLGKYAFKNFDQSADLRPGNLVVISAYKFHSGMEKYVVDKVMYPNNNPAFYLLAAQKEAER